MPGKEDSSDKEKHLELFLKIGLDERTARNTVANNKVTANLVSVIHEVLDSSLPVRPDAFDLFMFPSPSVWLPIKLRN